MRQIEADIAILKIGKSMQCYMLVMLYGPRIERGLKTGIPI